MLLILGKKVVAFKVAFIKFCFTFLEFLDFVSLLVFSVVQAWKLGTNVWAVLDAGQVDVAYFWTMTQL